MFMAKQTMRLESEEVAWQRQQRTSLEEEESLVTLPLLSVEECDTSFGIMVCCEEAMVVKSRIECVIELERRRDVWCNSVGFECLV